jgi:hypothetical protein
MPRRHLDLIDPRDEQRLEQLARQFDRAWRAGERPGIESYLPAGGVLRQAVLVELVMTELEYRGKAGEPARVEAYVQRFPELGSDPSVLGELLAVEGEILGSGCRADQPELPLHPRRLGRFHLLEAVGAGSSGVVYKAVDTELGRWVAVKIPRLGELLPQEERERFLREARSAAQLCHPGIVSVHDVGQVEGTC